MVTVQADPSRLEVILDRVRKICQLVSGIQAVSPTTPKASYVFPAVILNAGKSQTVGHTSHDVETRDITIMLLTGPADAKHQMSLEAATVPLIDAIHQVLLPRRQLELDDGGLVMRAGKSGDTGAQTITYAGTNYIGSIITLTVRYDVMEI